MPLKSQAQQKFTSSQQPEPAKETDKTLPVHVAMDRAFKTHVARNKKKKK